MSNPKKVRTSYPCDITAYSRQSAARKARSRANLPQQPNYDARVRHYNRHLKALEKARCIVDCQSPMVPKNVFPKTSEYNIRGRAFQRIERDNSRLLRNIATIYSGSGSIDNNLEFICMDRKGHFREKKVSELVFQNYQMYQKFRRVKATYSRDRDAEWYAVQEKLMDNISLFPLHFKKCPCAINELEIIEASIKKPTQYAYLQIEMQDTTVCNVVCELYAGMCPFTCENFKTLCSSATSCDNKSLTYRWKNVEKLVSIPNEINGKSFRSYWQIGSYVNVLPEFLNYTATEDSEIRHSEAFLLTRPLSINTGLFYITTSPAPYLNGLCSVFGKVIGPGTKFLKKMQEMNINKFGAPRRALIITDCGVIESPSAVPKPVMLHEFIARAREDMASMKAASSHPSGAPSRTVTLQDLARRSQHDVAPMDDDDEDEDADNEDDGDDVNTSYRQPSQVGTSANLSSNAQSKTMATGRNSAADASTISRVPSNSQSKAATTVRNSVVDASGRASIVGTSSNLPSNSQSKAATSLRNSVVDTSSRASQVGTSTNIPSNVQSKAATSVRNSVVDASGRASIVGTSANLPSSAQSKAATSVRNSVVDASSRAPSIVGSANLPSNAQSQSKAMTIANSAQLTPNDGNGGEDEDEDEEEEAEDPGKNGEE